jgi:hypothetical protein
MKRWAAGLIVSAALLAPAAPVGAAVVTNEAKKACGPKGSAAACRAYLYKQCVTAAKKHGASSSEAAAQCGG